MKYLLIYISRKSENKSFIYLLFYDSIVITMNEIFEFGYHKHTKWH